MPSKKKASEGIALLSMYADDDDDEMEDVDEEEEIARPLSDADNGKGADDVTEGGKEITPPQISVFSPSQQKTTNLELNYVYSRKSRLTIVDYGHEEGALSPEAEKGELVATSRVTYGELLQTTEGEFGEKKSPGVTRLPTPSTHATPQSLDPTDQAESDAMNYAGNDLEAAETEYAVMVSVDEQKDTDPLDKFLPPPPNAKCSEELQRKIKKFITLKKEEGRSFNAEVRNRKEYRNPDFLLHAVTYQNIDQIGSCFSKDVFDPHGYDKSDFYDEIEADMSRETERRGQESKRSQKIDFASAGIQQANVIPMLKLNLPNPGSIAIAAGMSNITPTTLDGTGRDGRQSKKSKWDKVEVPGGQENPSVGAHAALMSAAKAGGGYSAFANQRRKEAEEKRSSHKKLERIIKC